MDHITVTSNGRSYRMACDDGEEERLAALAERFDGASGKFVDHQWHIGAHLAIFGQTGGGEKLVK